MIRLDINLGDTILMGKFRNKKVVVKEIGENELGLPTVNGRVIVNFRYFSKKSKNESKLQLKSLLEDK